MAMTVPADLRDRLLHALGALVVNFSALEESLRDALWLLSGGDNQAINVLTAGLGFRNLVEKFGAVCRESDKLRTPVSDVEQFCGYLHSLNDERNQLIHSAWAIRPSQDAPQRFKRKASTKAGFTLDVQTVDPEEILAMAEKLRLVEVKLWEFVP